MPEGWSSIGGDDSAPLSFVCKRNWFVMSLQRISELLSAHGLHIVSEADLVEPNRTLKDYDILQGLSDAMLVRLVEHPFVALARWASHELSLRTARGKGGQ